MDVAFFTLVYFYGHCKGSWIVLTKFFNRFSVLKIDSHGIKQLKKSLFILQTGRRRIRTHSRVLKNYETRQNAQLIHERVHINALEKKLAVFN